MAASLKGRSLLTLRDWSADEIRAVLDLAHELKREGRARREGRASRSGRGKSGARFSGMSLAMLFEKRSTRTRCAFETAFAEEGGHPVFLSTQDIHLGAKESLEDTARVLGRMFDAIEFRGYRQETVQALAEHAGLPVYNGLTDLYHPTQVLADLMTLEEARGKLGGLRLAYVGDGRNNVATSLLIGCAKMGVHCTVASPAELQPAAGHMEYCRAEAAGTGARIAVESAAADAVRGADAVYTDVWVSLGEEGKEGERMALLEPFRVDGALMQRAASENRETIFLHCLPAVRGNEVTGEVMDGERSRVWDQAENRKHTIKALMAATLCG